MKIITKILRIFLYIFWSIFILMWIATWSEWGWIISWFLTLMFSLLILPIIYDKIIEFYKEKNPDFKKLKFLLGYICIVFWGWVISFWILSSWVGSIQNEETNKIEQITNLRVEYNIEDTYTTNEEIEITLNYENLESLKINWKEIGTEGISQTYSFPLVLWMNQIEIIWTNWTVERKSVNNIERINKEEEQERLAKIEKEKIAKQEEAEIQRIAAEQEEEIKKQAEINKIKEEINTFISLTDNHKPDYSSVSKLEITALLFWSYAITSEKYKTHANNEVQNLALNLERKIQSLQVREFPKMRKAYVWLVDKKMWEFNIDAYGKWGGTETIELVWWYFANNRNKLDTYGTLKDMLKLLRFDRANFKWYEYEDTYTYWEVGWLPDNKVTSKLQ